MAFTSHEAVFAPSASMGSNQPPGTLVAQRTGYEPLVARNANGRYVLASPDLAPNAYTVQGQPPTMPMPLGSPTMRPPRGPPYQYVSHDEVPVDFRDILLSDSPYLAARTFFDHRPSNRAQSDSAYGTNNPYTGGSPSVSGQTAVSQTTAGLGDFQSMHIADRQPPNHQTSSALFMHGKQQPDVRSSYCPSVSSAGHADVITAEVEKHIRLDGNAYSCGLCPASKLKKAEIV